MGAFHAIYFSFPCMKYERNCLSVTLTFNPKSPTDSDLGKDEVDLKQLQWNLTSLQSIPCLCQCRIGVWMWSWPYQSYPVTTRITSLKLLQISVTHTSYPQQCTGSRMRRTNCQLGDVLSGKKIRVSLKVCLMAGIFCSDRSSDCFP